ncbi:MAG TPA: phosphoribulokinase [Streptosporangiaceae bacterium]|jgi:phosphoribulokinase|nr:phosphoribulokinase [Streptosporangiaceae bacterium]
MAIRAGMKRPTFVAVGGDSGSGKSTLTAGFYRIFPADQITSVCLSDYHALDRRERNLIGVTALDPRANNFALMENQLLELKRGNPITKPVYDHSDGTFGPPEEIQPKEVVIVQGVHPFLVPGVRGLFDLNVWLDPETELKHKWKVQRDVARRGYTEEQVYAEIAAREPDVAAYVTPQRRFADLIVRFCRPGPSRPDDEHLGVRIIERATLPRLNLEGVLARTGEGFRVTQEDDDETVLEIDGAIKRAAAQQLADRIWDHFDARHQHLRHLSLDQFGDFTDDVMGKHHSDPLALVQLLLVHRILTARKSMLLKVPLSVHEQMIHACDRRG